MDLITEKARPVANEPSKSRWKTPGEFVHSILSFTRLEIPEAEVYETVATFDAEVDPLTAHDALSTVFGQKAGMGAYLFRADSAIAGRYWVRSAQPWTRWPTLARSALEPKRIVIQLAEGLMYRFNLQACAGRVFVEGNDKRVEPYHTVQEIEGWFAEQAAACGMRLLMVSACPHTLRFAHRGQRFKVAYASIEGAFEVSNASALRKRLFKGFGSYRRCGLGMMELSS